MESRHGARGFAVALALMLGAAPALAHGWTFRPSFGGDPSGVNASARTFEVFKAGASSTDPTAKPGGTTGGGVGMGRATTAGPARAKNPFSHLDREIHVDWKLVFLPVLKQEGYDARVGSIVDALTLPAGSGGWMRAARPSIVLLTDPGNKDHQYLVEKLENDVRFKAASAFFNCYRLEALEDGQAPKEARLMVFAGNGGLLGEVAGDRKLAQAYGLLEDGYRAATGADLGNLVWKMDYFLRARVALAQVLKYSAGGIVCPDCGHERDDVVTEIAKLKLRQQECEQTIASLRAPLKRS